MRNIYNTIPVLKENKFNFEKFEKLYKEINKNKGLNDISTYSFSRLLFKNGYYENVISTITDYRLSKKLSSELNFLLGQTYFSKLEYINAEESFIKAIAKKPKKNLSKPQKHVKRTKKNT